MKDVRITVSLDPTAADVLQRLTEANGDSNRSLAMRQLLRQEAARLAAQQEQPSKEARHDQ